MLALACEKWTSLRDTIHLTNAVPPSNMIACSLTEMRAHLHAKSFPQSPCGIRQTHHFFATTSILAPSPDGHLVPQIHFHLCASSDCTKFNSSHAAFLIPLKMTIPPCVTSSQMPLTNDVLLRVLVLTCVDGFHQNVASPDALLHPFASPSKCQQEHITFMFAP